MKTAVIYARVSSTGDRQTTERQVADLKRYIDLNDMELIKVYEEKMSGGALAAMRIGRLPEDKRPSACIDCRSCEAVCPQQIKVADILADFTEKLKA